MASITGLQSGEFTDIDVIYSISIDGDSGQNGQVLSSDGENTLWINGSAIDREDLTAANDTITISGGAYDGAVARTIQTNKVPNALTAGTNISFNTGTTYDGSGAITITATDTNTQLNLTADLPIVIDSSGGGLNKNVELNFDSDTLNVGGGELAVSAVPNVLTAGTNLSYSSGADFDGGNARTINLDTSITSMTSIAFKTDTTTTSITGNSYPLKETSITNCKITDTSNIVSPFFFVSVYDPSSADSDSLSTSFSTIFSSNLSTSFVAKATSCIISLQVFNYSISGSRWLYLQLGDKGGAEWSAGTTEGGYGTGTRATNRNIHYSDETDKQLEVVEWYLQGLTKGTTYTVNPMAKTSSTLNYIYAGGNYPASILKGYYLPS
tara:strand:+ start:85 stop:1230 length:1146 start_codon:yes stop_codon:yes gene_type:complete